MTFILRLNLPSSCLISCESKVFRLWKTAGILWSNLTLILQSLSTKTLYFPVIWQWFLTLTSFAQIQHLVEFSKSSICSFVKMFLHHITTILTFVDHTANKVVCKHYFRLPYRIGWATRTNTVFWHLVPTVQ